MLKIYSRVYPFFYHTVRYIWYQYR